MSINSKSSHFYQRDYHILKQVPENPYLGNTLSEDLKWGSHINKITKKANSTLEFLRWNLKHCPGHPASPPPSPPAPPPLSRPNLQNNRLPISNTISFGIQFSRMRPASASSREITARETKAVLLGCCRIWPSHHSRPEGRRTD